MNLCYFHKFPFNQNDPNNDTLIQWYKIKNRWRRQDTEETMEFPLNSAAKSV